MKSVLYFYYENCPACESTTQVVNELSNAGFHVEKKNYQDASLKFKPPSAPCILLIEDGQIFDLYHEESIRAFYKNIGFYPELFNFKNLFEYLSHILKTEKSFKNEFNIKLP